MSEFDKVDRFLNLYRKVKLAEVERWCARAADDISPPVMAPDEAIVAAVRYALGDA